MSRIDCAFITLALNCFFGPGALLPQSNVLTANYDNSRTNSNVKEKVLNKSNVNAASFGKIGSFPVDGQIYAQALYAGGVPIPGRGLRNVVYAVTMHNSIYAIDSDAPGSLTPLWQVNLGPSVPSSVLNFTDILPEVGILSTPVIDIERQVIYVVSDTLEGGLPVFRVHALSLSSGQELLNGPVVISASVVGEGAGGVNGTVAFDALMQLQRPGLALVNGTLYVAFGSHGDGGNYHGWMIAFDASDLRRRVAVFNTTPNTMGGSFWQAGRAPVIDDAGNLFAVTANGEFTGTSEFGDSLLKLSGRDLTLLDWYTPDNWADLRDNDLDLGSAGAMLIPGTNQLLTAGKAGDLLLINAGSLSHLGSMHSSTVESICANPNGVFDFALWSRSDGAIVYVHEPWGPLQAYRITAGHLDGTASSQSDSRVPSLFSGIAVSADGDLSQTGIVWQTTGNYDFRGVPGTLHALDAEDLSNELWNSEMVPARDTLGRFAKFVAPTVVNSRVYVPTFSNQLAIYGLRSDEVPGPKDVRITSIANGASLLTDAVSPGEVVTIFGANLGPITVSNLQIDSRGKAATTLAGTQVLFDGIPAPLLYTSSVEVGTVVPFGTAGPTAQVQVVYLGQSSPSVTIPVVPATPALFAQDGTGGGPGAILNSDGTLNSYDHPASPGSVVALYGTGLGQTDPLGQDGKVTSDVVPLTPVLPIMVQIDGRPAEILYSGAAPGLVQGIVQVNIRIPDTTPSAYGLRITLAAGEYLSPSIITFNVR